jgi:pyrroline-5-carboxylate reductase
MSLQDARITFIGGGMMGTAMFSGLLNNDLVSPAQIVVADPNQQRGQELVKQYGITYHTDNAAAVTDTQIVVLAVKPQFFHAVAADLRGQLDSATVILSIMAGIKVETIAQKLGVDRIIRSMPNTPGAIGQGITAWLATDTVSEEGKRQAQMILAALGATLQVTKEDHLDIATAVSGSGPAYVMLFIESMIDAAVHMGMSRADAEKLVLHTVQGSATYAVESETHPTILRNQVTSPGGTTAEALYHMERDGLRSAVSRGMWAAYQRAVALGGGDPRKP